MGDGQAFVPDITITAENRQPVYIEYETTKCTPEDFSVKCDKFAKVTNWLNFVVPSQTALETIKTHAEDWIEKIKKERTLEKPVTINLSTIASIRKSEDPEMLKWDESIRANSTKQKNRKDGTSLIMLVTMAEEEIVTIKEGITQLGAGTLMHGKIFCMFFKQICG